MKPAFKLLFIEGIVLCLPANHLALEPWFEWNAMLSHKEREVFERNKHRVPTTLTFWK